MTSYTLSTPVTLTDKRLHVFVIPAGTPVKRSIFGEHHFWLKDDPGYPTDIRDQICFGVSVPPEFVKTTEHLPAMPIVDAPLILQLEKLANQTGNPFALDAQSLLHRIKNYTT